MNATEIDAVLSATLEDRRLTRPERQALRAVLDAWRRGVRLRVVSLAGIAAITGLPRRVCLEPQPHHRETRMIASLKKAARLLLAMGAGASVSFGATLMLSTPAQASQVACYAEECNASCQDAGFQLGKCVKAACTSTLPRILLAPC